MDKAWSFDIDIVWIVVIFVIIILGYAELKFTTKQLKKDVDLIWKKFEDHTKEVMTALTEIKIQLAKIEGANSKGEKNE